MFFLNFLRLFILDNIKRALFFAEKSDESNKFNSRRLFFQRTIDMNEPNH